MTLSLTDGKESKTKSILTDSLCKYKISLRELDRVLRNTLASFPAINCQSLHYRHLEKEKITALKHLKCNFEGKISL